jgi:HPt (histidine-containing phosphotransfer) domain-containing protein
VLRVLLKRTMISKSDSSFKPPLDALVLAELRTEMGGAESPDFQEAVAAYLQDAALRVNALEEAAARQTLERIQMEAHTLRGSSSYFGARQFQKLCSQIESLAKANDVVKLKESLTELKKEFQRVRQALEAEGVHGPA